MHRPSSHGIAGSLVACLTLACGGGGGNGGGGAIAAPVSQFSSGFEFRQDVQLGGGGVTDAEAADFDGDGLSDLVEADFVTARLHVALGNEDGSFSPFFQVDTPGTPWNVEVGDVTGDGELDLVLICTSTSGGQRAVVVYRGLGGGQFVEDGTLQLPTDPFDVCIVESGPSAGNFYVALLNQGTYEFRWSATNGLELLTELPRSAVGFSSFSVALIDATGDGLLDVVAGEISGMSADRLVVYAADGNGSFSAPTVTNVLVDEPIVDNVGDVDGDGRDDLAIAQIGADGVLLLRGGPTGLETPFTLAVGGTSTSALFEDLDGDGMADLAATLGDHNAVAVRMATAPLVWGPAVVYSTGETPRWVGVGRFGDTDEVDLYCANVPDVSILHGDGTGSFRGARGYFVGDEPQFVRVVDMDQDGHLDAVTIDLFQNQIVYMRGAGDGSFTNEGEIELTPASTETAGYLLVEDFDEDGTPDVATSVQSAGLVQVLENVGSGLPVARSPGAGGTLVGSSPLGLDAADVNGDGHLDIVVANSGDDSLQVLMGAGDLTFQATTPIPVPYRPVFVLLEDLDLDGNIDAAVATGTTAGTDAHMILFAGDGAGGFNLAFEQSLPHVAAVLSSADIDEDGFPDIIASQPRQTADSVLVLLGRGGLGFDIAPFNVGFRLGTAEVVDLNGDAHLDMIVPMRDGEYVIGLGDGTGLFPETLPPTGEQIPAPFGAINAALEDVDEDGLPDVLTVSPRSPYLWVGRNDGSLFGAN